MKGPGVLGNRRTRAIFSEEQRPKIRGTAPLPKYKVSGSILQQYYRNIAATYYGNTAAILRQYWISHAN